MYGVGGPISENVEKPRVFNGFFEGAKVARTFQEWKEVVEKMVFW